MAIQIKNIKVEQEAMQGPENKQDKFKIDC